VTYVAQCNLKASICKCSMSPADQHPAPLRLPCYITVV
jgi:hypothetical protein